MHSNRSPISTRAKLYPAPMAPTSPAAPAFTAFATLAVVAILFLSCLAFPLHASAKTSPEVCYKMTPSLVDAAYDYLNEVYVTKCPALGFRLNYGMNEDKANLKKLANQITKDLSTSTEKTYAIIEWCLDNIEYGEGSAIPQDVFYDRKGYCIGYASLISQLLRTQGIPAVWVDGWRGDMKKLTHEQLYRDLNFEGHAWVFARLNGKWTMFDPLFNGTDAITDRDYIASWYYFASVEGIDVTYPGMDLALAGGGMAFVYQDGRFMDLNEGEPLCENSSKAINDLNISVTAFTEEGRINYLDPSKSTDGMAVGEIFRGGWFGYYGTYYNYAYENGVKPHGTVLPSRGKNYYFNQGEGYQILAPEGSYWLRYGLFTVAPGFSGKTILHSDLEEYVGDPTHRITFKNADPEGTSVGTISDDGTFTAKEPGVCLIEYQCVRIEDNANMTTGYFNILVADAKPVPDFSSRKKNLEAATISGLVTKTYSGQAQTQKPIVERFGRTLKQGTDYTLSYKHNTDVGIATVIVKGKGAYTGTIRADFKIVKAKQPLTVSAANKTAKRSAVKQKAVNITKALKVKKSQGKVSYKNVSTQKAAKKFKVNSKNGTITVPKGTKKGTYKVMVKVTAKGTANYKSGSKTVTVKVVVK